MMALSVFASGVPQLPFRAAARLVSGFPRPLRLSPFLALLGLAVWMVPAYVHAQGPPSDIADHCGGYGVEHAKESVRNHNSVVKRAKAPQMFLPREYPDGRYKVWKEECSQLDLERDLHAGWRAATVAAGGLFMVAFAYAGILLMSERLSGNPNSQARNAIMVSVMGLLITAFGMVLWKGFLAGVLGDASLDVGSTIPFGMPDPGASRN